MLVGRPRLRLKISVSFVERKDGKWAQGSKTVGLETSGEGRGTGRKPAPGVVREHVLGGGARVLLTVTAKRTTCTT